MARWFSDERACRGWVIFWALLVLLAFASWARTGCSTEPRTSRLTSYTITAQYGGAAQIAREHGWRGDWREYMDDVEQVNGWRGWPTLQVGDVIVVPDYRGGGRG
jgi:hypothetical protein